MRNNISKILAEAFVNCTSAVASNSIVKLTHRGKDIPITVDMEIKDNKVASWCPEYGSFWTSVCGCNTLLIRSRLSILIWEMLVNEKIPWKSGRTYVQRKGFLYIGKEFITDLEAKQWHVYPPVGKAHPGCRIYKGE